MVEENIKRAADAVANADAFFFTSGAGIGVDSGLPDFRGDEGFWKAYPPIAKLGISFVEMANPMWFERNPLMAWGFYGHRLNLYRSTVPHNGFSMMLKIAEERAGDYFIFTSNVDGQYQKAGFGDDKINECHGSIHHMQCCHNCTPDIWDGAYVKVDVDEESFLAAEPLPQCHHCGGMARPNILMFGDWGWHSWRTDEQQKRMSIWLDSVRGKNVVIIECGAGTALPTVRYQSESVKRSHGATLIRINPRDHNGPEGTISIPAGALEGLSRILKPQA